MWTDFLLDCSAGTVVYSADPAKLQVTAVSEQSNVLAR